MTRETKRVLVTWGAKHRGTEGIGRLIAARLVTRGLSVTTLPADDVHSLDDFDGVVLGGALCDGRWTTSARRFIRRHRKALRTMPVWLFASGTLDDSAGEQVPANEVATLAGRVGAQAHVTFGARAESNVKRDRTNTKPLASDWRDPRQVRRWADEIADALPTAIPRNIIEPKAHSLTRLLTHGLVAALVTAAVLATAPLVGGRAALALHGILAPLIVGLVAVHYFQPVGAHDPFPTALTFCALVFGAEIAVIDAKLLATSVLEGPAFWIPTGVVFATTWATGSLLHALPWTDPVKTDGRRSDDPPMGRPERYARGQRASATRSS